MTTLGFIGTGHMGSMLVHKFLETGIVEAKDVLASNRTTEKAKRLAESTGIRAENNKTVAELSDIILLCVRPLEVQNVLHELGHLLTPKKLIVSVAGDVPLSTLTSQCPCRVLRAFPSITSETLQGVTLLAFGDNATESDRRRIDYLFRAIGETLEADEKDFEVLADLTSSGPGYCAALMNEFVRAAKRQGVREELAERLVKKTMLGTALLLKEESFKGLVDSVATKGGITEAGVQVIQMDAPRLFDQLFAATRAKHKLVKEKLMQEK